MLVGELSAARCRRCDRLLFRRIMTEGFTEERVENGLYYRFVPEGDITLFQIKCECGLVHSEEMEI